MENNIKSVLEALLFVSGEPISFSSLEKVMGKDSAFLKTEAEKLAEEYKERNSGLRIIFQDNKVQMVTAGENSEIVEKLLKIDIEGELSRSAIETISIIAYRGPISRAEIDDIRGVNTSFTLRQLAIRGLIEKIDNPNDARAYLYQISFDFLRHLGIEKVEDLPKFNELRQRELVSEEIVKNSNEENFSVSESDGREIVKAEESLEEAADGEDIEDKLEE